MEQTEFYRHYLARFIAIGSGEVSFNLRSYQGSKSQQFRGDQDSLNANYIFSATASSLEDLASKCFTGHKFTARDQFFTPFNKGPHSVVLDHDLPSTRAVLCPVTGEEMAEFITRYSQLDRKFVL